LQCAARALAGFKRVSFAALERVIVAAAIEDDAGISHDHAGPKQAVQAGLEAHHVAILVHDRDVAGIAVMASIAVKDLLHWAI
jgi:hypothetical protein